MPLDVPGKQPANELVPGLPPESGEVRPAEGPGLQHGVPAPPPTIPGLGERLVREYKIAGTRAAHELLDLPQISRLWIFPPFDRVWPGPTAACTGAASASWRTPPQFREYLHREFPEQASQWNDPQGRRQFLKLMSASLALAGVSACTRQPAEKIIPYVRQPEDLVPGRPLFFATAIPFAGVAAPVLVESHEGHPTKVEGNPQHPASLGATDSFTQASILTCTIPDRAKTVLYRGEVRGWGDFLTALQNVARGSADEAGGRHPVPARSRSPLRRSSSRSR